MSGDPSKNIVDEDNKKYFTKEQECNNNTRVSPRNRMMKDQYEDEDAIDSVQTSNHGTLFTRVSLQPELFGDKGQIEHLYKDSKWVCVPASEGCWMCTCQEITVNELRKHKVIGKPIFNFVGSN